jgi:hypothetical protein
MFSRQALLSVLLCVGGLISEPLTSVAAPSVSGLEDSTCTPTKTITLDAPNLDWQAAEQHDRERYDSPNRKILTGVEIAAMFQRPKNVEELLLNIKQAVDRDLLVQSAFYKTAVLSEFFAASAISWKTEKGVGVRQTATLIFHNPPFTGLYGYATLTRHSLSSGAQVVEHLVGGQIRLRFENLAAPLVVRTVVNTFGMPILAYKGCGQPGYGHVPDQDDPTCKGRMIYTYSKRDFPSALLAINQAEFKIRLDAVERRSPTWDYRSAEGRQRFLCDEDELRDISVLQTQF